MITWAFFLLCGWAVREHSPGQEVQTDEELIAWIKQYTNSIARMCSFPSYFPNLLDIPGWVGFIDCPFFLLLYVAYADTSGTCSMLPRDKGGVVDPQLRASKRMDSPAYVCTPTANPICRCTERTTCASLIFPSSPCTSMLPPRVCLVSSRHAMPCHALILWLRRFLAYVYAMAEQGGGISSISFLFSLTCVSLPCWFCVASDIIKGII